MTELGLSALAEMHDADRRRGIDPSARIPAVVVEAPAPPGPGVRIDPPDWDREHAEFEQREREARIAEAAALLEPVEAPDRPTAPAPKRRWRKSEAA